MNIIKGSLWRPPSDSNHIVAHTQEGDSIFLDGDHTVLVVGLPVPYRTNGKTGLTPVVVFPEGVKADMSSAWFDLEGTEDPSFMKLSLVAGGT